MKLMLSLPDELVNKVKLESKKSYRPVSKYIQMILENNLEKEAKKWSAESEWPIMSALTRELEKVCEQEGISFQHFMQKLKGRKESPQKWVEQGNTNGQSKT